MEARLIAFLILTPFALAFIYAGIHEFRRYKSEGRASYGLVFNKETGTTHVTGIPEGEDPYDPEDYDPSAYNDPDARTGAEKDADGNADGGEPDTDTEKTDDAEDPARSERLDDEEEDENDATDRTHGRTG